MQIDKKFLSFLIDAEKPFVKIQHPFMIKCLRKMSPKGNKLNLKLVTTTTDVMCDSEKLKDWEGKDFAF